ncbi:hypothetical protein EK904_004293 [Melospiza melodia maxima]|nr:hypothetical protein EK904_004293 [Melospiza melodia maxima]
MHEEFMERDSTSLIHQENFRGVTIASHQWLVMCHQETLTVKERLLLHEARVPHLNFFQNYQEFSNVEELAYF